jgi:hypothetical protein
MNTLIYILLLVGYYLFYVAQIDSFFYGSKEQESTSKVNFIYQQF